MNVAVITKEIEEKAHELALMSARIPCIDQEQLARFATIDDQIVAYGVKDLTDMSSEELLADLLGK